LNPEAYCRHRTVEFRQYSGTTDFTKMEKRVVFEIRRLQKWNANIAEACALKTERRATASSATYANRAIENNRHYTVTMPTKKGLTTRSWHWPKRESGFEIQHGFWISPRQHYSAELYKLLIQSLSRLSLLNGHMKQMK